MAIPASLHQSGGTALKIRGKHSMKKAFIILLGIVMFYTNASFPWLRISIMPSSVAMATITVIFQQGKKPPVYVPGSITLDN